MGYTQQIYYNRSTFSLDNWPENHHYHVESSSPLQYSTFKNPPTLLIWSTIVLCAISDVSAKCSTETSLLTESPLTTEACPCESKNSSLIKLRRFGNSDLLPIPSL